MPSFLDFNSTKSFRDKILGRTLQQPNGPQTFSDTSYSEQNLSDISNISLGNVDTNRTSDLKSIQTINLYKPESFFIEENIDTLPRRANLSLYPYFTTGDYNLFGIMNTKSYDTESELFKFAAYNIRNNTQGPVYSRIAQNVEKTTLGRVRILDALNGNSAAALNIITGREPLVESNYSITINPDNPSGVPVDFLTAVEGADNFPISIIPGDYLSNPQNPLNYNSQNPLQLGTLLNDATGVLASMVGIQGKPKISPRPSDILIEYMGQGQKNRLFDLLSYSRYSPNYTALSTVNNFLQNKLQIKSPIQIPGNTYIGDDRYYDVKYSMSDFWDRTVRGNYYTSLMFDSGSAELFHKSKNISEGGSVGGNLTWYSKYSKNALGTNNKSYSDNSSDFESKLSTKFEYRRDSILGNTQELLNSLPSDGGISRSHVANVIDQTSRIFQEGDVKISRGSAIKYTDKFGQETGMEYCRVWTKDRPYLHLSDTMKKTDIIRKYDGSVLGGRGRVWNTSIAPMSNGKKSFDNSSNITNGYQYGGGFYAKKYMFSIENLAWKTSNKDGFRVSDLPVCEKGPNGGRVMWFPPYDLKVSEQNSARWEENSFLGRPEPIYTYQNASRSGQVSFKVVVDHPSILNLLTREFFKDKSDEESDNYINAFFAGCQDLDFYSLIQTYTTLDTNDVSNIQAYLNAGTPKDVIKQYKYTSTDVTINKPNSSPEIPTSVNIPDFNGQLFFMNDRPTVGKSKGITDELYTATENEYFGLKNQYSTDLLSDLQKLAVDGTPEAKKDRKTIFNTESTLPSGTSGQTITLQVNKINEAFTSLDKNSSEFYTKCQEIKTALSGNTIQEVSVTIFTSASEVADDTYNFYLGVRRAYSIINDMFENIKNDKKPKIQWFEDADLKKYFKSGLTTKDTYKEYKFQDFGWKTEGVLKVSYITKGENTPLSTANPAPGSQDNINCHTPIYTKYGLKNTAPIAFYCRQASVNIKVTKKEEQPKPTKTGGSSTIPKITVSPDTPITTYNKKPPIDVMKRIIMKTLSECFYFKQLEDNSPVTFKSLKEKLKYFHPGFHSTTPEGLNSRLTFLLQCLRPGDTIPIKGLADNADLNSRNTSFGPPPICVIRIGDFYHSKIIIRDVAISYEDGPWDMNPEGIGYQPMIANVTLQVSFIGGQGLEKPVEKLQNALSSNFFANTEMYDERSESTTTTIAGKKTEDFTKEFLEQLSKKPEFELIKDIGTPGIDIQQGTYLGTVSGTNMNYTNLVNLMFSTVGSYTNTYQSTYNSLLKKYGFEIVSTILGPIHRTIKDITIQNSQTGTYTYSMFGQYIPLLDLATIVKKIKVIMDYSITNTNLTSFIFNFFDISEEKCSIVEEELKKEIQTLVANSIDDIIGNKLIKDLETSRNEIITNIDKVNFLVKYGHDGQISETTYTQLPLTGFDSTTFYGEYSNVITYLNSTYSPFTQDLTYDLLSTNQYTTNQITSILSVLLLESKDKIKSMILKMVRSNKVFTSNDYENMIRITDNFFKLPTEKKFTLDKFPVRKNNKALTYPSETPSEIDITDTTQKDNLNKILINKKGISGTTNLLNFYKG
jgi:outer membrane protein OmpA-like peptidoglycan-associated protein